MRRAQDRAQLRQEQPRLGEAEADRAQAQRRIGRDAREPVEPFLVLVGAEVERADRDRLAAHALGHAAVGLELLVLGRQAVAVEEQELGAEEADAGRAVLERLLEVLRQLDVRVQLDRARRRASSPAWCAAACSFAARARARSASAGTRRAPPCPG